MQSRDAEEEVKDGTQISEQVTIGSTSILSRECHKYVPLSSSVKFYCKRRSLPKQINFQLPKTPFEPPMMRIVGNKLIFLLLKSSFKHVKKILPSFVESFE